MVPAAECFTPAWRCLPSQSLLGLTPAPTTAAEYDTMTHLHPPPASRNLSSNRFPPCTPHSRPYQRDPLSPLGDDQLFEVSSVCLHWALHRVDVPLCPTVFAFEDLERALRSFIRGDLSHAPKIFLINESREKGLTNLHVFISHP